MMTRLVPKVFFDHMSEGLDLFVNGLGFKVLHQDATLAVVARDEAKAYVVESSEYAAKDRPDFFEKARLAPSELERSDEEAMGCAGVRSPRQDGCLRDLPPVVAMLAKAGVNPAVSRFADREH